MSYNKKIKGTIDRTRLFLLNKATTYFSITASDSHKSLEGVLLVEGITKNSIASFEKYCKDLDYELFFSRFNNKNDTISLFVKKSSCTYQDIEMTKFSIQPLLSSIIDDNNKDKNDEKDQTTTTTKQPSYLSHKYAFETEKDKRVFLDCIDTLYDFSENEINIFLVVEIQPLNVLYCPRGNK